VLRERAELWDALSPVGAKLRQAAPNGRDFYPEPGRYENALAQHTRRLETIGELLAEVETELSGIDDQG
jgi:hypothetical protein